MNYSEKLTQLIEGNNGVLFTKQATQAGIPRVYITEFVRSGKLERLERGVYISKDSLDDEMYRIQTKYSSAVFSHDSALFIHDLTDRAPLQQSITVTAGYNSKKIKETGVKVYSIKKDLYKLGLITAKTMFGREIRCYNAERTICDILRSKSQMDMDIVTNAIKRYVRRKDKNLPLLMRYADEFKVTKILRYYLEVLL